MSNRVVRIGTRGSALARWQTEYVGGLLQSARSDLRIEIQEITTSGDRILDTPLPQMGGKGVFTAELETALREGTIDLAVHSLKDLPTENPPGLMIGAVPQRANAQDVLVSRFGHTFKTLPDGAIIGTSSHRRAAQLLRVRPDLQMVDIRGNVDTRIRKTFEGSYDAILLAAAGLERLGLTHVISEYLSFDDMLPAPGQGALAIQCRVDADSQNLLAPINHRETELAITAERAFLAGLGGGCALPIAAYGVIQNDVLHLCGRVTAPDGSRQVDVQLEGAPSEAQKLGAELAQKALASGAGELLGQ